MVGMCTESEQLSKSLILHFHVYHVVHDCFGWLVSVMIREVGGGEKIRPAVCGCYSVIVLK